MSDTPRTDTEPKHGGWQKELVLADFARQLERENGQLRSVLAAAGWRETPTGWQKDTFIG